MTKPTNRKNAPNTAKTPQKTPQTDADERKKVREGLRQANAARVMPGSRGGTLKVGNPGNAGGPGRPPSAIRETLRKSFDERIEVLQKIVDNDLIEVKDRIKALELLARYGLGTSDSVDLNATMKPLIVREVDEAPEAQ